MNGEILVSVVAILLITSVASGTCEQACRFCLPADHCEYCPAHWGCIVDPNINELIYEQYCPAPVRGCPPGSFSFKLDVERIITAIISTFHGPSNAPSTIGLLSDSGIVYGPWPVSGSPGMNGEANAYRIACPNVQLPPGTYSIMDWGQSTWSFAPGDCAGLKGHYFVFALKETPPVNHLPIAGAVSAVTDENVPTNIEVLAQCLDLDNDTLAVISASTPSHGTAAVNSDGTVTYTPAQNYCGPDSFTCTISDGQATATATVLLSINCTIVSINCWTVSVKEIDDCIRGLADEAFLPPASEQKDAFTKKLNAVGGQIVDKNYRGATNQLQNDVRIRTDGYLGGNPGDDWITDQNAQIRVCGMIDELIANLEIQSQAPRVYPG